MAYKFAVGARVKVIRMADSGYTKGAAVVGQVGEIKHIDVTGVPYRVCIDGVDLMFYADELEDAPVCKLCDGEGTLECPTCEGEGCGSWGPKYVCSGCKGEKVVPCECQAEGKATGKDDWE